MAMQRRLRALGIAVAATLAAWAVQASNLPKLLASEASEATTPQGSPPSLRARVFALLVRDRARAIELAFGQTFLPQVTDLRIVMLGSREWAEAGLSGITAYEPQSHTLYFSRRLQYAPAPPTTMSARQYWPWHEEPLRELYPLVEVIDAALWTALLQESARAHDLTWPHPQCRSLKVAERLPCEMLVQGVTTHTSRIKAPLFNENRMSEIWPEDISELDTSRSNDRAYQNVRNYGGYLLLRPLVREFGVARTLSYIAGTPFRIEDNNLRLSAERYQQRAQEALAW
jgi:hypothetical protein